MFNRIIIPRKQVSRMRSQAGFRKFVSEEMPGISKHLSPGERRALEQRFESAVGSGAATKKDLEGLVRDIKKSRESRGDVFSEHEENLLERDIDTLMRKRGTHLSDSRMDD